MTKPHLMLAAAAFSAITIPTAYSSCENLSNISRRIASARYISSQPPIARDSYVLIESPSEAHKAKSTPEERVHELNAERVVSVNSLVARYGRDMPATAILSMGSLRQLVLTYPQGLGTSRHIIDAGTVAQSFSYKGASYFAFVDARNYNGPQIVMAEDGKFCSVLLVGHDGRSPFGNLPMLVQRGYEFAAVPEGVELKVEYKSATNRPYDNLILTGIGSTIDFELRNVAASGTSTKAESKSVDRFATLPTPPITMGRFTFQVLAIEDKQITVKVIGDDFRYSQSQIQTRVPAR
jgi:hypothetical protein